MNNIKKYFFILLFPLFIYMVFAPVEPVKKNPKITASEVLDHIKYLASDELGGRFPGTKGDSLTEDYIIARFSSYKLKPAGEDGYKQNFNFVSEVKLGENNSFTVTSVGEKMEFKSPEDYTPLGFSAVGAAEGDLVFAGYGIDAPDQNYSDFKDIDLKGKIAVILRNSPGYNNPHDNPFGQYENPRRKANMVKEAGAIGVIIINGPNHGEDELIKLRVVSEKIDIPVISAKRSAFEKLFAANNKDLAKIQADIDSFKTSNSFPLGGCKVRIQTDLKFITSYSNNLIGMIEGSDPVLKKEVIVVGAHMDHLGDGLKYGSLYDSHEPAIHNGADDNASGTSGVLELAEYFAWKKKDLKRSIIFMTFGAEEAGLVGSAYFTKSELFKKYNIVAMVNLDMIGRLAQNKLTVGGVGTSSIWDKMLDSLNGIAKFDLSKNNEGFGPSDHSSFYAKDVPVLFFFTSLHSDYHRPTDDWDKINSEGEVKILGMVVDVVKSVNNLPLKPDYIKSKEKTSENRNMGFRVTLGIIPDYSSTTDGMGVTGVKSGSVGENAGLQAGDIIKKMGDFEIKNIYDYTDALSRFKPGEETTLIVKRGAEELTLNVTFKK